MTRVLIYCRISADPTGNAAGVERQLKECRELADQLGWHVMEDVLKPDNDISAYSGKPRPQYRKMLDEIRADRADAIIAWHPDRLYRRLVDLEELVDVVNQHNTVIRTVKAGEVDLSTPTGRAMARTAAVWQGHEVEHGIERMKAAKQDLAAQGKYRGSSRPFGYESDGVTPVPVEAAQVLDATRRVLALESLASVVRDWRDRGIVSPKGGSFTPRGLRYVLMRARNAGQVEHHGEIVGPAQWPAIVPEHEWRAVRTMLEDPARINAVDTRTRKHLGSGLFLCGICADGMTVKGGSMGGKNRSFPAYRCKTNRHLAKSMRATDRYVNAVIKEILRKPETRLRLWDVPEEDMAALQAEADAISADLDGLRAALGKREIDLRTFRVASEEMQRGLAVVNGRLQSAVSRSPLAGIADAEDVDHAYDHATLDRQRAVIQTLAVVMLLPSARGRKKGGLYFDEDSVVVDPL